MLRLASWISLTVFALVALGCGPRRLSPLPEGWPEVVFVAPVQNETADLDAPVMVRPMMVRWLAEQGYYPLPIAAVDALLRREHIAEAGVFAGVPPGNVGKAVGTEAILYLNIKDWSSKYLAVTSIVAVEIEGVLVDARTGEHLWKDSKKVSRTPPSSSGGSSSCLGSLIGSAISAAAHAAITPYRPLAQEVVQSLAARLPRGPLHPIWKESEK